MGEVVMIIGKSGSGKSTSLRNFEDGEVGILNVMGKRLPFRNKLTSVNRPSYDTCKAALKGNDFRAYVLDDSTYLMQMQNFDLATQKGYDKFTLMAQEFEQLLMSAIADTDDDTLVYFLHHPTFSDDGSSKPQTIGKMLDNQLNIEGVFPIVIECTVIDGEHYFITKNNGSNIVKTPMGMFKKERIDNDLKMVDTTIREYWGLKPLSEPKLVPMPGADKLAELKGDK